MSDTDRTVEQLFKDASPRPVPGAAETHAAREALREEWRAVTDQHRVRRRRVRYAVAASILIGLASVLSFLQVGLPEPAVVASIQKSFGTIYLLGDESGPAKPEELAAVRSGEVIVTGDDAGVALAWSDGGSLRLHKNTEVEFLNESTVFLRAGQVYFDSTPVNLQDDGPTMSVPALQIETPHGTVSHVGTQFMTAVDLNSLKVSVREGSVNIDGRYYPQLAQRGEQVLVRGRQRPVVLQVSSYGDAWGWVADTAPPVVVEGKSVDDFLNWVGRELGMRVQYASAEIEDVAKHKAVLIGRVDSPPVEALEKRMLTAALNWRFEAGVIYVFESH